MERRNKNLTVARPGARSSYEYSNSGHTAPESQSAWNDLPKYRGFEYSQRPLYSPSSPLSPATSSGTSSPIKFVHVDTATFRALTEDVVQESRDHSDIGTGPGLSRLHPRSMSGPLVRGPEPPVEARFRSKSGPLISGSHVHRAVPSHSGPLLGGFVKRDVNQDEGSCSSISEVAERTSYLSLDNEFGIKPAKQVQCTPSKIAYSAPLQPTQSDMAHSSEPKPCVAHIPLRISTSRHHIPQPSPRVPKSGPLSSPNSMMSGDSSHTRYQLPDIGLQQRAQALFSPSQERSPVLWSPQRRSKAPVLPGQMAGNEPVVAFQLPAPPSDDAGQPVTVPLESEGIEAIIVARGLASAISRKECKKGYI